MPDNPIEGLGAKLKKNKLLIPAALVGGGVGLFFLLKGGGGSGAQRQQEYFPGVPAQDTEGGESGGTGFTDALTDLANQFQTSTDELSEQLVTDRESAAQANKDIFDYIGDVQTGFQDALNQVAGGFSTVDYGAPPAAPVDFGYDAPLTSDSSFFDVTDDVMSPLLEAVTNPPLSRQMTSGTASNKADPVSKTGSSGVRTSVPSTPFNDIKGGNVRIVAPPAPAKKESQPTRVLTAQFPSASPIRVVASQTAPAPVQPKQTAPARAGSTPAPKAAPKPPAQTRGGRTITK